MTPNTYTIEMTGEEKKLEGVLELLQPFGVQEVVRSGVLAIARGSKVAGKRDEGRLRLTQRKQAVGE